MIQKSNLYAEKVFAEQPVALWALDDNVDFVSLFSQENKQILFEENNTWSYTSNVVNISSTLSNYALDNNSINAPIKNSPSVSIEYISDQTNREIVLITEDFSKNIFDSNSSLFSFGFHFYPVSTNISSIEIGYKEGSQETIKSFSNVEVANWSFYSNTFPVPTSNTFKMFIRVKTSSSNLVSFYINGISFGQDCEQFIYESTGVTPYSSNLPQISLEDLPANIALSQSKSSVAFAYGLSEIPAYYLASSKKMYAYNDGLPLVYGAKNSTKIIANENSKPSLIVPGNGFLNESGKYQSISVEFWIRVDAQNTEPRRIFGPISSTDGLYVDGSLILFKVGDNISSYFVGEWDRPMLIDIRFGSNTASILINSEEVISMDVSPESLQFPESLSSENKDQDWLGFYAYSDVPLLEIDCVGIYPYLVSEILAKRRFVYGQGVKTAGNTLGISTEIDYKTARYSNNYLYPDIGKWSSGIYQNVEVSDNLLSTPKYSLPTIKTFEDMSYSEWLSLCSQDSQDQSLAHVSFGVSNGGYLLVDNYNFLNEPIKGFYGVFSINENQSDTETLFFVEDEYNGNSFSITAYQNLIRYRLVYGGISYILKTEYYDAVSLTYAGIDIDKLSEKHGQLVSSFFGSPERLKLYVGGRPDREDQFLGNIYTFGVCNKRSIEKLSSYIVDGTLTNEKTFYLVSNNTVNSIYGGIPSTTSWTSEIDGGITSTTGIVWTRTTDAGYPADYSLFSLIEFNATYTVTPRNYLGSFTIDIQTDSYWQDYIPLKHFAKFVEDKDGEKVYSLEYLQFNVDYPKTKNIVNGFYETQDEDVKTYISFQYLNSGANKLIDDFTYTQKLSSSDIVAPTVSISQLSPNFLNTKYEVLDNTLINLPKEINFEKLAIVVHINISSDGILNAPVGIRSLQISGQALDKNKPTKIYSKFGDEIELYKKNGIYEDYSGTKNINIYKNNTPYLYLTDKSGIEFKDTQDNSGIKLSINKNKEEDYNLSVISFVGKFLKSSFDAGRVKFATLDFVENSVLNKINFYVEGIDSGRRAKIYAINSKTGQSVTDVRYFINGVAVTSIVISPRQWNSIAIQFIPGVSLSGISGDITFNFNGFLLNTLESKRIFGLQAYTDFRYRNWIESLTILDQSTSWQEVYSGQLTWSDLLLAEQTGIKTFNVSKGYAGLTGTDKMIASDPDNIVNISNYKYNILKDISWNSTIVKPV